MTEKKRDHEEAVIVLREPFTPNVSLIRRSLKQYHSSQLTPRAPVAEPKAPPPSGPPRARER